MVQPLSPNCVGPSPLVPAGVICFVFQVSPPSADTEIISGAGELPPSAKCLPRLRNCTEHRYTRPKNWLDAALSAQICSLSSKAVAPPPRVLTTTGGFQPFLSAMLAGVGLSRRETAAPKIPRKNGFGNTGKVKLGGET